jgi:SAM-dependent methyltransferase
MSERSSNEEYWDHLASEFDVEVFNTLKNDLNNTILAHIDRFRSKRRIAIDFGCGVGRYLRVLSERFKTVYATDISSSCLRVARAANVSLKNVSYLQQDLGRPGLPFPKADFAVNVNVLLMPSLRTRRGILQNIVKLLKPRAHALIVAPSLEAALYSNFRLLQWNRRTGSKHDSDSSIALTRRNADREFFASGIVGIEGVRTKHYLKEEFEVVLKEAGLKVVEIEKVEYSWKAVFDKPPRWMKGPQPWDWLVLCKKD